MNFTGKVLLVDDEPHIRKFIAQILKKFGSPKIVEAGNGREAVVAFQKDRPDLVLLDVNMPFMGGLEALKEIKTLDPTAVVVMLTSVSNRQTVEQSLTLGADGYIRKDTPKEEIATALEGIITESFTRDPEPK